MRPRRSIVVLSFLIAFLTACSGGGGGSGPGGIGLEDLNADGRIVILSFGDSITRGTGDGPQATQAPPVVVAGYPARLRDALGVEVINAGVPGERTREGRRRLPGALAANTPDYVILLEGTNDIGEGNVNSALDNIAAMVDSIFASGALPILGTVTPTCCGHRNSHPQSRIDSFNEGVRRIAEANGIPVIDFYAAFLPPEPGAVFDETSGLLHVPEGLHPTPAGYDVMAAEAVALF